MSPELLAFLVAGGTLDDLCTDHGEAPEQQFACEACRIADSLMSFGVTRVQVPLTLQRTQTLAFVATRLLRSRDLDPTRLTRGPPSIS